MKQAEKDEAVKEATVNLECAEKNLGYAYQREEEAWNRVSAEPGTGARLAWFDSMVTLMNYRGEKKNWAVKLQFAQNALVEPEVSAPAA